MCAESPGLAAHARRAHSPSLVTEAIRVTRVFTAIGLALVVTVAACQPTMRVEPPKEPITINLNVKLDAEVRVKLEEQAEQDIEKNPDIF